VPGFFLDPLDSVSRGINREKEQEGRSGEKRSKVGARDRAALLRVLRGKECLAFVGKTPTVGEWCRISVECFDTGRWTW
jgi:hypothetical protein